MIEYFDLARNIAQLLTIPTEILLNIINRVRFEDIENLTSCCKDLCSIGHAHLQEHLHKKRAITSISCGPTTNARWPNPFKLLRDVVMDDEHALYTTSMIIKDFNTIIDNDGSKSGNGFHPDLSGTEDRIAQKVLGCKYIAGFERECLDFTISFVNEHHDLNIGFVENGWIHDILTGRRPDSALALLIASLPNLTYLELSDSSWEAGSIHAMLCRVIWESHMAPQESHSLSNLTTVVFHTRDVDQFEDLRLFLQFLHLPSVRTLVGKRLHGPNALQDRIRGDSEIDVGMNAICVRSSTRKISIEET